MLYLVGLLAAASIGLGWVLQQRAAVRRSGGDPLSPRLVLRLVHDRVWWLGLAAVLTGNGLWAFSLHLGTVSLVEPLLATSLVFAFAFSALLRRQAPPRAELIGAVVVVLALGGFLAAAQPQDARHVTPSLTGALIAAAVIAVVVTALVSRGRRLPFAAAAAVFATAAGLLYGLQDVAARWALVTLDQHGLAALVASPATYLVAGTAVGGVLLSQSAFGAARLAHSLPSMTVTEPLVGIALGVALLGDRLTATGGALAAELGCLVALVCGVVLVGRSFRTPPLPVAVPAPAPSTPR